jgi:methionyl-tRNA formyltransferase
MRVLLLVNNWLGWQMTDWLYQQQAAIVGVVVHPHEKSAYRDEIVQLATTHQSPLWEANRIAEPDTLAAIQALRADMAISGLFGYILKPDFLHLFPAGCINIHPALLPYNRGAYTNVWSIIDETPAGVTIHYIDHGIDTGDIIAQQEVTIEPIDTGQTLYHKLEQAGIELFRQTWPQIAAVQAPRTPQPLHTGTYHNKRDVDAMDAIDLDDTYTARHLLNILRARTFPPYAAAYFWQDGKKVFVRVQL